MFPHRLIAADDDFYSYLIDQSCRFNDDDSANLSWTPGGAADDYKKWSFSFEAKRCLLGSDQMILGAGSLATNRTIIYFDANDKLVFYSYYTAAVRASVSSDWVFRDPTSWYQFLITLDAANNQVTFYCNGVEISQTVATAPHNSDHRINNIVSNRIAKNPYDSTLFGDYYLAYVHMVDGLELTPTSFGEFKNGVWIPKAYTGSYGTNGYYLDFSNSAHFGEDQSGNGNDFTDSGLATNDQVLDTPTDNYPTMNVLDKNATLTTSDGNLKPNPNGASWRGIRSTKFVSTGKHYFEFEITDNDRGIVGLANSDESLSVKLGSTANGWGLLWDAGGTWKKIHAGSETALTGAASVSDIGQIAWDMDAGKMWLGVNNVWFASGDPAAGTNEIWSNLSGDLSPATSLYSADVIINFGQLGFTYTPPTGFKALSSSNMDDPTIMDSSDGCVTDSDTGANIPTTLAALRSGWGSYIDIYKNLSNIESWDVIFSDDSANSLHFDANDAKGAKQSLAAGDTYSGVSLRVGTDYGCFTDEVSHTNGSATDTAHGLGSCDVGIVKLTDIAGSWHMEHPGLSASRNIVIDTSAAESATVYCTVDATNITIASGAPTGTYRVIAFRETQGFSKFDIHTGNANADGPYADYGGRAAVVMFKNTDDTDSWLFFNDERLGYNVDNNDLNPDTDAVEGTADMIDICSQGGKVRINNAEINANAEVYISLVFMAQPGKWSNAR